MTMTREELREKMEAELAEVREKYIKLAAAEEEKRKQEEQKNKKNAETAELRRAAAYALTPYLKNIGVFKDTDTVSDLEKILADVEKDMTNFGDRMVFPFFL